MALGVEPIVGKMVLQSSGSGQISEKDFIRFRHKEVARLNGAVDSTHLFVEGAAKV